MGGMDVFHKHLVDDFFDERKSPDNWRKLKVGAIAMCSLGTIGLVTAEPHGTTFPDGATGVAWTGVHLAFCEDGLAQKIQMKPGDQWSSRKPVVLFESLEDLLIELGRLSCIAKSSAERRKLEGSY